MKTVFALAVAMLVLVCLADPVEACNGRPFLRLSARFAKPAPTFAAPAAAVGSCQRPSARPIPAYNPPASQSLPPAVGTCPGGRCPSR